jgi:hypothetical protein
MFIDPETDGLIKLGLAVRREEQRLLAKIAELSDKLKIVEDPVKAKIAMAIHEDQDRLAYLKSIDPDERG